MVANDSEDSNENSPVGDALLNYERPEKKPAINSKKPGNGRQKVPKIKVEVTETQDIPVFKASTSFDRQEKRKTASDPVPARSSLFIDESAPKSNPSTEEPAKKPTKVVEETDPISQRLVQLEQRINASLQQKIEIIVANTLDGSVKNQLLTELVGKLKTEVTSDVKRSFQVYFSVDVKDALKSTIKKELTQEICTELRGEFAREIIQAREISSKLSGSYDNYKKGVIDDVTKVIELKLRDEFSREIGLAREASNAIKEDLKPLKKSIKEELRDTISNDIMKLIPGLFRKELKDDLIREIMDDIGKQTGSEFASEITASIRDTVKEDINKFMKHRAKMVMLNAGQEAPVHLIFVDFNNLWAVASKVTTKYPNIKHLLQDLRDVLREYDEKFMPDRVSGFIFYSKYHETTINQVMNFTFNDEPELEAMLKQFQPEIESEKKMQQNGQETTYRDVDVLLAARATEMISKYGARIASVTIVSGDGDMNPIIDIAKRQGIYTIVFSFKQAMSSLLKYNADEAHYLNTIPLHKR
nr:NYN domain-containing protein [Candidatus Sigynarchaeota archaeon]